MLVPVFMLPLLTPDEQEALVRVGAAAFRNLVDATARLDRNRHAAVQLPARNADVDQRLTFSGTTVLKRATVEAVAAYHMAATEAPDVYCRTFHCLLTSVLYTLELPTAAHPYHYVAVRWLLLAPTLPWMKPRDVVVVEYMDAFVGRDGQRGWARCVHSIDHRCAPSLVATHGFVRGHFFQSGLTALHDHSTTMKAHMLLQCDQAHSFAARYTTKALCASLLRHFDTLNERLYVHFHVLPRKISVSASTWRTDDYASTARGDTSACLYCMQPFSILRRPTMCETCHQVLCKKCTRRITKSSKHRVCLTCYVRHEVDDSPPSFYHEPQLVDSPGWSEFVARRATAPADDRFVLSV
ncbi:hypothetical protein ACHHYP_20464 [Achlya hypogyna]|uniref:FYVE-type domain-containing protein n=1 Tax=Achlya hypogyna TaxID=1202772 RepID=A0A1V9ZI47_ACHHY|nr:hypothetical protein ACHHYP_20464 [Achlya hypogyna]